MFDREGNSDRVLAPSKVVSLKAREGREEGFVSATVSQMRQSKKRLNIFCGLILTLSVCSLTVDGQTPQPQEDTQSWNDVQLTVPLNKYVDFSTTATVRFGSNITRVSDGRFAFGFVLKATKSLSLQPFYLYVRARNSSGSFRNEHRLNLRASYRFPFKSVGLSHRSLIERRLRRPTNSWRYRPSVTFEKDLPKSWIRGSKFFLTEEVFYDSLLKRFSRNRVTLGINKSISKQLSVDVYYMRQNDGFSRPGDLHVIWTTWRVRPY